MTPTTARSAPQTAWSAWLLRRGVTSEELSRATDYSLAAIKSWRRLRKSPNARMPQLGALHLIAQALIAIAKSRKIPQREIQSKWTLTVARLSRLMRAPATRERKPKP